MDLLRPRECSNCKIRVDFIELRQCANSGGSGTEPSVYCIRRCKQCRTPDCQVAGHLTCWDLHLPRDPTMWASHVKIDLLSELFVRAATYMEKNPEKQQAMHEEDKLALWYVVKRLNSNEAPRLFLTDRFRQLCNPGISDNRYSSHQYPGFVSFIGDTCVGKSTLLRAMIMMGLIDRDTSSLSHNTNLRGIINDSEVKLERLREVLSTKASCPVARGNILENMTDPTSFGVHLYADAAAVINDRKDSRGQTVRRETPILFADCEGFRAGVRTTNAERGESSTRLGVRSRQRSASWASHESVAQPEVPAWSPTNMTASSEITANSYSKNDKDGVDLFYARFLYTVSDVVVFVVKGDTNMQTEMQRLLEWATSAVYRAISHLPHKTLVVVRNMSLLHHRALYDPAVLGNHLLKSLDDLWEGSSVLREFRTEHNNRQRINARKINSNEDLFKIFFQEVKVCYIPDKARAPTEELYDQYRQLRNQITAASQDSQDRRAKAWMQYNVPTWSHILNRAFEHFRTSDGPFDFYKASRNDNPNPISVSDHTTNFLRHLHLLESFPQKMFSCTVSICLVSWMVRRFDLVASEPDQMFERELKDWCTTGLQMFEEKDQRCAYVEEESNPNYRCVQQRFSHYHEHSNEKGFRRPGDFLDSSKLDEDPIQKINDLFVQFVEQLCVGEGGAHVRPDANQSKQLRETTLQEFLPYWKTIQSNKTCLTCLQAVPDHMLQCGHSYCAQCVQEFGKPSEYFECGWTMDHCILCAASWQEQGHLFQLHPRCAGVRLLTLDGGGVRGIVEIMLLERLLEAVGLDLQINELFDLIVGTSTGGIIALGLATQRMSPEKMRDKFLTFAEKTFKHRREGPLITALDPLRITSFTLLVLRLTSSIYPTGPLRESIQDLFGQTANIFSPARRNIRVAVTSCKEKATTFCFITNYNRPTLSNEQDFEREDDNTKEMKIWEAGMATSAAPFYFRPFERESVKKDYVDGALEANFPVPVALDEFARIWQGPDGNKAQLDIVVTVGTGIQAKEGNPLPAVLKIGGAEEVWYNFYNNMNSENNWRRFYNTQMKDSELAWRVHRLNARLEAPNVMLDDHHRMRQIYEYLKRHSESLPLYLSVAESLIANLFFFEPNAMQKGQHTAGRKALAGTIRCRLARDSPALKELVMQIDGFWHRELPAATTGVWARDEQLWTPIKLLNHELNQVRTNKKWLRITHTIASSAEAGEAKHVIAVRLRRKRLPDISDLIPISGFPASFNSLQKKAKGR